MAKSWAWSYSKLKNYDTCPRRHYEVDIAKNYSDEGGQALIWGNQVHDALAKALKGVSLLPPEMHDYQHWLDRVAHGPGELLVEQKFALTKDLLPTEYFSPKVWYRGICDALRLDGPVALAIDWKTGKVLDDSVQLGLMAQCIFAFHPEIKRVRTEFIWLKEDCSTGETYNRNDAAGMWVGLMPRVTVLESAAKTMTYPPKPGRLCARFCPVLSCSHHGKRH